MMPLGSRGGAKHFSQKVGELGKLQNAIRNHMWLRAEKSLCGRKMAAFSAFSKKVPFPKMGKYEELRKAPLGQNSGSLGDLPKRGLSRQGRIKPSKRDYLPKPRSSKGLFSKRGYAHKSRRKPLWAMQQSSGGVLETSFIKKWSGIERGEVRLQSGFSPEK